MPAYFTLFNDESDPQSKLIVKTLSDSCPDFVSIQTSGQITLLDGDGRAYYGSKAILDAIKIEVDRRNRILERNRIKYLSNPKSVLDQDVLDSLVAFRISHVCIPWDGELSLKIDNQVYLGGLEILGAVEAEFILQQLAKVRGVPRSCISSIKDITVDEYKKIRDLVVNSENIPDGTSTSFEPDRSTDLRLSAFTRLTDEIAARHKFSEKRSLS